MGWLMGLASILPYSSSQDCHRKEYRSDFWIAIAAGLVVGQCPLSVDISLDQASGIPKPTFLFSTQNRFLFFGAGKWTKPCTTGYMVAT